MAAAAGAGSVADAKGPGKAQSETEAALPLSRHQEAAAAILSAFLHADTPARLLRRARFVEGLCAQRADDGAAAEVMRRLRDEDASASDGVAYWVDDERSDPLYGARCWPVSIVKALALDKHQRSSVALAWVLRALLVLRVIPAPPKQPAKPLLAPVSAARSDAAAAKPVTDAERRRRDGIIFHPNGEGSVFPAAVYAADFANFALLHALLSLPLWWGVRLDAVNAHHNCTPLWGVCILCAGPEVPRDQHLSAVRALLPRTSTAALNLVPTGENAVVRALLSASVHQPTALLERVKRWADIVELLCSAAGGCPDDGQRLDVFASDALAYIECAPAKYWGQYAADWRRMCDAVTGAAARVNAYPDNLLTALRAVLRFKPARVPGPLLALVVAYAHVPRTASGTAPAR